MTREQAIEQAVRNCLTDPLMRKILYLTQSGGPHTTDGRYWVDRTCWMVRVEFARLMS